MNLPFKIDKSWTLFLDRDGVINKRLVDDYVKHWDKFEFLDGVLEAIEKFNLMFGTIVIVTNQQGIGKGLMTIAQVDEIHQKMISVINENGGRIDKCYICPNLKSDHATCRKPEIGMAIQAQKDFPNINFEKSIIFGDSASDMQFGKNAGMKRVFVKTKPEDFAKANEIGFDLEIDGLLDFFD